MPFLITELMKFFGYKWHEVMELPLKLFWSLLRNKYRLEAQENLRLAQIVSFSNLTEEGRKEFIATQIERMGTIQLSEERDEEGLNKLRNM